MDPLEDALGWLALTVEALKVPLGNIVDEGEILEQGSVALVMQLVSLDGANQSK